MLPICCISSLCMFGPCSIDILLMANKSSQNSTKDQQDGDEREGMMREAQAMLREMRYRSCTGQKKLADKEKNEAEKCKFKHSQKH